MQNLNTIQDKLRELGTTKGATVGLHKLNKDKLAKDLGMAPATLWRKFQGISIWTLEDLIKLEQLGVI